MTPQSEIIMELFDQHFKLVQHQMGFKIVLSKWDFFTNNNLNKLYKSEILTPCGVNCPLVLNCGNTILSSFPLVLNCGNTIQC